MAEANPDLRDVAQIFIENGANFLAMDQASLANESPKLIFHLPVGTSDDQWDAINDSLSAYGFVGTRGGEVALNGMTMLLEPRHILHSGLYCYGRVPLYIDRSVPGLDPVPLEKGLENVRAFLERGTDPTPVATDTIALRDLVENLAAKGAASVEASRDFLRDEIPRIELRIPIVPANGAPVIAPYDRVTIDGREYDLNYTLTLDGPTPEVWLPLYLSDSVVGADPITVEEGMQDLKTTLSQVRAEK